MKEKIKFRLHEILKDREYTVRGFAREAKLNHATVNRIVHNQTRGITLEMIWRICDFLKIPPGELFVVVK